MNVTEFFNQPETDDTLQNIRKEYLNSKRNLQELLTNSSPIRRPESESKEFKIKSSKMNDENLRSQLRDQLNNNVYVPEARSSGLEKCLHEQSNEIPISQDEYIQLQKQIMHQDLSIQSLKNDLQQQKTLIDNLFSKIMILEQNLNIANRMYKNEYQPHNSMGNQNPIYEQKISNVDDTNVLLNQLELRSNIQKQSTRQYSGIDDSTTKLIQLSGNNNKY